VWKKFRVAKNNEWNEFKLLRKIKKCRYEFMVIETWKNKIN
jgi:hypothetical protein